MDTRILPELNGVFGVVGAKRFRCQIISCHGKSAGPRATAKLPEPTDATFTFQKFGDPQFTESRVESVDLRDGLPPYVTALQG